jgi:hypothetical protein
MALTERMHMFEDDSATLEAIAKTFDESSREYRALKHAAIALWYVLTEGHERFARYVDEFEGPQTDEQRRSLIELGIDPDAETPD